MFFSFQENVHDMIESEKTGKQKYFRIFGMEIQRTKRKIGNKHRLSIVANVEDLVRITHTQVNK